MRTPARGTSCAAVVESIALSSSAAAGLAGRHTLLLTKCATNSMTVFIEKKHANVKVLVKSVRGRL